MLNISLKKIFLYKYRRFFESKINKEIDKQFEFVGKLREFGHLNSNFAGKNILAKSIINQFNDISDDFLKKKASSLSNITGRYNYRTFITENFDKKLLKDYANQDIFIKNFKQYFGLIPTVRFISVWLDYPTNENLEKNSQIFHRDYDDVFLVKTFLCLTDIDDKNGPFQFLEKSHLDPWVKDYKNYLKDTKPVSMTAKKGDLYMADTNGFHRGKKLITGYRVLLNVHYISKNPMAKNPANIIN